MSWNNVPSYEAVEEVFTLLGELEGKRKLLSIDIELKTLDIKKDNPRKPWLIKEATVAEQKVLAEIENDIEILKAKRDMYLYWKDMYRTLAYKGLT